MNRDDKHNLNFLMNLSIDGLARWFEQASEDDIIYATELLANYERDLDRQLMEVMPAGTTLH
jgi:hypothetical protein